MKGKPKVKKTTKKMTSIPSEGMIKEGEASKKKKIKPKPGERIPTNGGYKCGGKVKAKKK